MSRSCDNRLLCCFLVCFAIAARSVSAQSPAGEDRFALGVRDTEPQTAADQLKTFTLPPGFQIRLVAAEPRIAKPMNLAFDARGRLWVSSSEEYPFAAKEGQVPRDTIRILEDTDRDGDADIVTTFADQLNIPIGLYPYRDGVICFSIPNILFLRDTDGDDKCDTREVLYGPFDTTRDTHGMCNAFRRGDDGWIYACHGFNNQSQVKGRDGNTVTMHSGNTFRFRPDGSRIEQFTHGQVNPFGMAIDQFGDHFTADCHTKPVTLLMQGGYYESFGKPHDGLGYVPNVMEHLHGSTAIGGIALGEHTTFPQEFQDSSFGGNVMTSRINRNQLQHIGSTVRAMEQPDLLSCSDPWFRPVDIVAGPDGALYVADFYNRIIGHYEVDLQHPGRDRFRGRIWKIEYTGPPSAEFTNGRVATDISRDSTDTLLERLGTAVPQLARMIADRLSDDIGMAAVPALKRALRDSSPLLRRRVLRILQRLDSLDLAALHQAVNDPDDLVRVHALRALGEVPAADENSASQRDGLLRAALSDSNAVVRRAAVMAAARHPSQATIPDLLQLFHQTPAEDVHLRHAVKMSLRNHLQNEEWFRRTAETATGSDVVLMSEISMALKTPAAGEFIALHVTQLADAVPNQLPEFLRFAAAYVSVASADLVTEAVRKRFSDDLPLQIQLLNSMQAGFAQRSLASPASVTQWATQVVTELLRMKSPDDLQGLSQPLPLAWSYLPHPDKPEPENCWVVSRMRDSADGQKRTPLFSSIEHGEQRTGIYRSAPFEWSESFSFYLAGHDGYPDKPAPGKNLVRLRDAESSQILHEFTPPRNDVAQKREVSSNSWKEKRVVLELVDGDSAGAFAWIAAGRFSVPQLNPDDVRENRLKALGLIAGFQLSAFEPALKHLLQDEQLERDGQVAAAAAFVRLHPDSRLAAAALIPGISGGSADLVARAIQAVLNQDTAQAAMVLGDIAQVATSAEQLRLAEQLAADGAGAESLLSLVAAGRMSARLLTRPTVRQRLEVIDRGVLKPRLAELTSGLPSEDAAVEKLIRERRQGFAASPGQAEAGRELFKKHCAICHQVAGEGKKVGPNLDGIGGRGADRLVEDLLAPSRNVDIAFRTTTVVTSEGKAYSGLLREVEGDRISIIDSQGRETLLMNSDVDERVAGMQSPMPANVAEILSEEQVMHLLAYLVSLRH